jgi:hypothetical protein
MVCYGNRFLICHEEMWGIGGLAPPFLTSALDGGKVVNFTPVSFYLCVHIAYSIHIAIIGGRGGHSVM